MHVEQVRRAGASGRAKLKVHSWDDGEREWERTMGVSGLVCHRQVKQADARCGGLGKTLAEHGNGG